MGGVADRIVADTRLERISNLLFLTLSHAAPVLPLDLTEDELVGRLIAFVDRNEHRMVRLVFEPAFVTDPDHLQPIVREFVEETVLLILKSAEKDEIVNEADPPVYRLTWPYDSSDFPFAEDDDEEND